MPSREISRRRYSLTSEEKTKDLVDVGVSSHVAAQAEGITDWLSDQKPDSLIAAFRFVGEALAVEEGEEGHGKGSKEAG